MDLRRRLGRGPSRISSSAVDLPVRYPWTGNIRELRNLLERVLLARATLYDKLARYGITSAG